jgi:A/G-specific adenine glycosylase
MLPNNLALIRRRLLGWYEKNKRDLPWRRTSDPYAIWISETMLQQTQVKTVLPYYEKFLEAFPTVTALDCAPLRQILHAWSGLGYYRRAENLKKSASELMRRHGGTMPQDYDKLRALPGIGDYTAGAILSIAFQKTYPAVDGNARRVFGRLFDIAGAKQLRAAAERLLPKSNPGNFNQAIIELGATICLPAEPLCLLCPLAAHCRVHRRGGTSKKPAPEKKMTFRNVTWPLAIVRRGKKILLRRRSSGGLLAGMWELPGGEKPSSDEVVTSLRRQLQEIGPISVLPVGIGEIRHSITYRRIRAPIFLFDLAGNDSIDLPASNWRWVVPATLDGYPASSMTLKAARVLASYDKSAC